MKIIFLDIDGVLNIMSNSYRTFMKPYGEHIEPHLVQRLNYIIDKTKANIVVSSSWKGNMDDLEKQLKEQGFKYWDRVVGKTSNKYQPRGNQIKGWLDDTELDISVYAVLEDEVVDVCGSKCSSIPARYVVEVDMREGLSQNDVDRVLYILEKDK